MSVRKAQQEKQTETRWERFLSTPMPGKVSKQSVLVAGVGGRGGGGGGAGRVVLHWEVEDDEKRSVGIGIVSDFALFDNEAVHPPNNNNNVCFCSSMTKKKTDKQVKNDLQLICLGHRMLWIKKKEKKKKGLESTLT